MARSKAILRKDAQTPGGIPGLADFLIGQGRKRNTPFFITGTDTGVGKTHLTLALIREFQQKGLSVAGFKPICCGDRADAVRLWKLTGGGHALDEINPIHLPKPIAPVSQKGPSWPVILKKVGNALCKLSREHPFILIEGAGGLFCPLDSRRTFRDLAATFQWAMVIVAMNRLGVLNHALLTLAAARVGDLKTVALYLNAHGKRGDLSQKTNAAVLARLTKLPVFYNSSSPRKRGRWKIE